MQSIKKNVLYNFIRTLLKVLFPIITFTYTSHILGVEVIGKLDFSKSVIQYFILVATLGMTTYGARECAKVRNNKENLSQVTHELLLINLISTAISYFSFIGYLTIIISKNDQYRTLLLIYSVSIILNSLSMEWLYVAVEDYKYITIRAALFQMIALCMMILFVRFPKDIYQYAVINVFATSGSYILNFFYCQRYVLLYRNKRLQIKRHFKALIILFAFDISTTLYTVLDTTMLGILTGDIAVGYYAAATKLNKIIIMMISSISAVIMPRLSYYIGHNDICEFQLLVQKVYNYVFLLSVPACIMIFILSKPIVLLLCGYEFDAAILASKIMAPIIIFIPFSVLTNNQTLIPLGKEKKVLFSTCIGAVMNLLCNAIFIPHYAQNGAAVGTVVAEGIVVAICLFNVNLYLNIKIIFRCYWNYWFAAIPIIIFGEIAIWTMKNSLLQILFTGGIGICSYVLLLFFLKNEYIKEMFMALLEKLK